MKIGLAIVSNNKDKLSRLAGTLDVLGDNIIIGVVTNPPIEKWERVKSIFKKAGAANEIRERFIQPEKRNDLMNMISLRSHSFELLSDCDFIMWTDDDFVFRKEDRQRYTPAAIGSKEALLAAVQFLKANKGAGVVQLYGFLGGAIYKYKEINATLKSPFTSYYGMVFRAKDRHFNPVFENYLGPLNDEAFCISRLVAGQSIHRLFNCLTKKDKTKKIGNENFSACVEKLIGERYNFNYKNTISKKMMKLHFDACGGKSAYAK